MYLLRYHPRAAGRLRGARGTYLSARQPRGSAWPYSHPSPCCEGPVSLVRYALAPSHLHFFSHPDKGRHSNKHLFPASIVQTARISSGFLSFPPVPLFLSLPAPLHFSLSNHPRLDITLPTMAKVATEFDKIIQDGRRTTSSRPTTLNLRHLTDHGSSLPQGASGRRMKPSRTKSSPRTVVKALPRSSRPRRARLSPAASV